MHGISNHSKQIFMWAKLGDENTSFFHSMATIRYRKNTISSLSQEDGLIALDHHEKAGLLWHSFK
jgi:hypothetical protein